MRLKQFKTLMNTLLLLIFLFPISVQATEVESVEITEYGLYSKHTAQIIYDPNIPSGERSLVSNTVLIEQTDRIPLAISDNVFGFRYRVNGSPQDDEIILDRKLIYPDPGVWDKKNNEFIKEYIYGVEMKISDKGFTAVRLTDEADLVPGPWTFQLWYKGKLLAEKTFTLVKE